MLYAYENIKFGTEYFRIKFIFNFLFMNNLLLSLVICGRLLVGCTLVLMGGGGLLMRN